MTFRNHCRDIRVVDGDTYVCVCECVGPTLIAPGLMFSGITQQLHVRHIDIDTPESRTEAGRLVTELVRLMVESAAVVEVEYSKLDKYGRALGTLLLDGENLGKWLLDNELADFYDGGSRSWTPEGLESVAQRAEEILFLWRNEE